LQVSRLPAPYRDPQDRHLTVPPPGSGVSRGGPSSASAHALSAEDLATPSPAPKEALHAPRTTLRGNGRSQAKAATDAARTLDVPLTTPAQIYCRWSLSCRCRTAAPL